jgi:protein-S-isoprenylcysteine O-methyltransferase Ste14
MFDVNRSDVAGAGYTAYVLALWSIVLPVGVLVGETGSAVPVWRPWPFAVLAVVALGSGVALVIAGGRRLARAGVGVFGTRPGPVLVTAGPYRYLRNPMDAGTVLVAAAPALALGLRQTWIVPVAAIVYLAVGFEPLEERRLLESFGDEYADYRRSVPRWFPRDAE